MKTSDEVTVDDYFHTLHLRVISQCSVLNTRNKSLTIAIVLTLQENKLVIINFVYF